MKGTTVTIAAGGAERARRARRLMKEATRVAGRWLRAETDVSELKGRKGEGEDERGGHEDIEETEETRAVADVEDRAVEEGVELGVEVGEFPAKKWR